MPAHLVHFLRDRNPQRGPPEHIDGEFVERFALRGDEGFSTLGSVTEPVLQGLGIRYYVSRKLDEIRTTIKGATTLAIDSRRPVAVLLTKDVLGMRK